MLLFTLKYKITNLKIDIKVVFQLVFSYWIKVNQRVNISCPFLNFKVMFNSPTLYNLLDFISAVNYRNNTLQTMVYAEFYRGLRL